MTTNALQNVAYLKNSNREKTFEQPWNDTFDQSIFRLMFVTK